MNNKFVIKYLFFYIIFVAILTFTIAQNLGYFENIQVINKLSTPDDIKILVFPEVIFPIAFFSLLMFYKIFYCFKRQGRTKKTLILSFVFADVIALLFYFIAFYIMLAGL